MIHSVVLDTNIIVSAILTINGNSAKILDAVLDNELRIYYSDQIIAEYEDVLFRPKFSFEPHRTQLILDTIQENGMWVNPAMNNIVFTDKTDRIFYDTAKTSDSFLITGNIRHFPQESFIVTPADFLRVF